MQQIIKIDRAKFYLCWDEKPTEKLIVDFNPIIKEFNLSGNFDLVHWQARPKGLRQFGIYNSISDTYQSTRDFIQWDSRKIELMQLDEKIFHHVPTAVICLKENE